jgi:hypothetical protein
MTTKPTSAATDDDGSQRPKFPALFCRLPLITSRSRASR